MSQRHVVVLGGSIAGLLTARVLSDRADDVIVVDRDQLPDGPLPRRGAPQGRHPHALLSSGERVLRTMFPGLIEDLIAGGAQVVTGHHVHQWIYGGYRASTPDSPPYICLSRPYLELGLRRRVAGLHNVTVRRADVLGVRAEHHRVVGVRLRDDTGESTVPATLVVDASGRGTQAPRWLEALGYPVPPVTTVHADIAYSTRLLRRTTRVYAEATAGAVQGDPVTNPRSGGYFSIEGDRWIVALMGVHGDRPPTDDAGFLAFAETLPKEDLARLIREEEPLGPAVGHRVPFSQWRRFEKLKRHPIGLVSLGDAICSFNPVYGQGMTTAALEAVALGGCADRFGLDSADLAPRYYKAAAKILAIPWAMGAGGDFAYPSTTGDKPPFINLVNRQTRRLVTAAQRDPAVADTFNRVAQLIAPPSAMVKPAMLVRILRANRQRPDRVVITPAALTDEPGRPSLRADHP